MSALIRHVGGQLAVEPLLKDIALGDDLALVPLPQLDGCLDLLGRQGGSFLRLNLE